MNRYLPHTVHPDAPLSYKPDRMSAYNVLTFGVKKLMRINFILQFNFLFLFIEDFRVDSISAIERTQARCAYTPR